MGFVPGVPELLIIVLIVVMLFGVGKLPEVFGAVGKGIKEFRKEAGDITSVPTTPAAPVVPAAPAAPMAPVAPVAMTTVPSNDGVNSTVQQPPQ